MAEGYGLSEQGVRMAKQRNFEELIEGKHWVVTDSDTLGGKQKTTMWTKRGVVRLGFFIKTPMAKEFRDWAEDYIVNERAPKAQAIAVPQNFSDALKLAYEQSLQIEMMKPKVEAYDDLIDSDGCVSTTYPATLYGYRPKFFLEFLTDSGYIQKFNFNNSQVRVIVENGIEWFVAKDVAKDVAEVLGYRDATAMARNVDKDDTHKVCTVDSIGKKQEVTVLNESGLYQAIWSSQRKEAKAFKKWVTSEVLPSIRKHGAYMTSDVLAQAIADPKFTVGLLQNLQEEREKRIEAEKTKAHISDKKTATAMATASVASRENERLKVQLDESLKYSTIRRQSQIHKRDFKWRELKKVSKELELPIKKVYDPLYEEEINSYHAKVWLQAYSIDIFEGSK